jgi:hypothetical protein
LKGNGKVKHSRVQTRKKSPIGLGVKASPCVTILGVTKKIPIAMIAISKPKGDRRKKKRRSDVPKSKNGIKRINVLSGIEPSGRLALPKSQ